MHFRSDRKAEMVVCMCISVDWKVDLRWRCCQVGVYDKIKYKTPIRWCLKP